MFFRDQIKQIARWWSSRNNPPPEPDDDARIARTSSLLADVFKKLMPSTYTTMGAVQNAAPFLHNPQTGPTIWAYIGLDSPMRGDSRGFVGLAHTLAEQLQGRMLYVDKAMLDGQFGATMELAQQLKTLAHKTGAPDIILGRYVNGGPHDATILIRHWNELLTHNTREIKGTVNPDIPLGLVSHDLTLENLAAAGVAFREQYPHLKDPVITVFMADLQDVNLEEASNRLALLAKKNDGGTLFFCPNGRTRTEDYAHLVKRTQDNLRGRKWQDLLHIEAPDYNGMVTGYNPYRGLIDQSAAAILLGESKSMLSEILFRGHRLYVYGDDAPELSLKSLQKEYIHELPRRAEKITANPLLPSLNITPSVARILAEEFNHFARLRTLAVQQSAPASLSRMDGPG